MRTEKKRRPNGRLRGVPRWGARPHAKHNHSIEPDEDSVKAVDLVTRAELWRELDGYSPEALENMGVYA